MMFHDESIEAMWKGLKNKTRRPCQEGDWWAGPPDRQDGQLLFYYKPVSAYAKGDVVYNIRNEGRLKWQVGNTYTINPPSKPDSRARFGKGIGSFKLLSIHCEPIADISHEDAMAEGVIAGPDGFTFSIKGKTFRGTTAQEAFLKSWIYLYSKSQLVESVWVHRIECTDTFKLRQTRMTYADL